MSWKTLTIQKPTHLPVLNLKKEPLALKVKPSDRVEVESGTMNIRINRVTYTLLVPVNENTDLSSQILVQPIFDRLLLGEFPPAKELKPKTEPFTASDPEDEVYFLTPEAESFAEEIPSDLFEDEFSQLDCLCPKAATRTYNGPGMENRVSINPTQHTWKTVSTKTPFFVALRKKTPKGWERQPRPVMVQPSDKIEIHPGTRNIRINGQDYTMNVLGDKLPLDDNNVVMLATTRPQSQERPSDTYDPTDDIFFYTREEIPPTEEEIGPHEWRTITTHTPFMVSLYKGGEEIEDRGFSGLTESGPTTFVIKTTDKVEIVWDTRNIRINGVVYQLARCVNELPLDEEYRMFFPTPSREVVQPKSMLSASVGHIGQARLQAQYHWNQDTTLDEQGWVVAPVITHIGDRRYVTNDPDTNVYRTYDPDTGTITEIGAEDPKDEAYFQETPDPVLDELFRSDR